MGLEKTLAFGWRSNGNADGFEQDHGRFVMEVYWNESTRHWLWIIWSGNTIVAQSPALGFKNLIEAKKAALRSASHMEKQAMNEDKKFR